MKILALDTATEACSAALLIDGVITSREVELGRGHAEYILAMIDELLAEAGETLRKLDGIAFGRGPGGFTGVRLAASVTQGLAFAVGLGVVPISDLMAVAQQVVGIDGSAQRVVVCNDARMREVYWGCFERGADGLVTPVGQEHVNAPERVVVPPAWSAARPEGAGRGFAAYPELLARLRPGLNSVHDTLLPSSREIALLAVPEVRAHRLVPAEQAIPVYLRDDVAKPANSRN